jgi:hypothetical protein
LGINTFRVRGAFGRSGRQPNAFDKFTTYAPLTSELGSGLSPANLGNPDLKPEVSTEFEGGAEVGLWDNRLGLDFTYWNRTVNDALVSKQFPVSGGFVARQLANVGELTANGIDLKANVFLVQRANIALDVFANAAYIRQEIVSIGGSAPIKVGGSYPRYRNFLTVNDPGPKGVSREGGYGPGALFGAALPKPCSQRPAGKTYTCLQPGEYAYDKNADGKPDTEAELLAWLASPRTLAQMDPMRFDEDGDADYLDHYLGKPYPDWTGAFGANLTLRKSWRLNANFEYRGGDFTVTNLTDAFRNAHGTIGTNTPRAANALAVLENPASSAAQRLEAAKTWLTLKALSPYDGLNQNEDGSFLRLREIGLTWSAPSALVSRIGAKDGAITLSGNNLFLWTKYEGVDPETNAIGVRADGGIDNNFLDAVDAFGWPLARRVALAVRLSF